MPGECCSILPCSTRISCRNEEPMSLHKVPSNEDDAKEWLRFISMANAEFVWKKCKKMYVCSKHFRKCCIHDTLSRKKVKQGHFPSVIDDQVILHPDSNSKCLPISPTENLKACSSFSYKSDKNVQNQPQNMSRMLSLFTVPRIVIEKRCTPIILRKATPKLPKSTVDKTLENFVKRIELTSTTQGNDSKQTCSTTHLYVEPAFKQNTDSCQAVIRPIPDLPNTSSCRGVYFRSNSKNATKKISPCCSKFNKQQKPIKGSNSILIASKIINKSTKQLSMKLKKIQKDIKTIIAATCDVEISCSRLSHSLRNSKTNFENLIDSNVTQGVVMNL